MQRFILGAILGAKIYARVENATIHIVTHAKFALTRGIETCNVRARANRVPYVCL